MLLAFLAACATTPPAPAAAPVAPPASAWVGSAACAACHAEESKQWAASWHHQTVRAATPEDRDQLSGFLACSDLDAGYVMGGRHETRWLTEDTANPWGSARWQALPCGISKGDDGPTLHHPEDWQTRPWETDCAGCHVTGFRGPKEGFLEPGVGCESCHGPGAEHAKSGDPKLIVSFPSTDEVTVCASCHLQGATSARTGLHVPDAFVPGRPLFDDWKFDWSKLDMTASPVDVHQKELIREHATGGPSSDLKCTSCHSMHGLNHEKHATVAPSSICFRCHEPDMKLKEYQQSCDVCEF
jgi:predicted CXXCH cytochrome family protein